MAISDKLTYLNTTKTKIREGLNSLGADLDTQDTFRSYADAIEGIYEDYPKITGEGESLTLDNTKQASMQIDYKGNTSQDGTPTPDVPVSVNVVSGDNTIDICGKNLLNVPNGTNTSAGLTITRSNGKITFVGTATGTYPNTGGFSFTLAPGTYTISSTNNNYDFYLWFRNSNNDLINSANLLKGTKTITVTSNEITILVIGVEHLTTGTTYNIETSIQIEKGSTATTYEPYIGNTYPIYLGVENLLNLADGTYTNNGVTAIVSNNEISINGTAGTGNSYINIPYSQTIEPKIEYTLSLNNDFTTSNTSDGLRLSTNDDTRGSFTALNRTKTFTFQNALANNQVTIRLMAGSSISNGTMKVQLEKGSKANHYTPYGANYIELCKIGTYQDYIYKDNGSWYLHKEIGKVVLNGSESWLQQPQTGFYRYGSSIENATSDSSLSNTIISKSNYFNGITFNSRNTNTNETIYFVTNNLQHQFFINTQTYTTLTNFTTWLSTHNTIVYYVLATPTNTLIEDTTLIEQLEESKLSYISQTNISQTNNDLPFNLDVKALRGE